MKSGTFTATTPQVHLSDVEPRPRLMNLWEKHRHGRAHWAIEFTAELTATFFYTFTGVGSTASWIIGNFMNIPNLGSLFQIGVAYAIGAVMAIAICSPTSNGHFNPAITIHAVLFGKCTPMRGLRLIFAQILGAYIACLIIYVQYHNLIEPIEAGLVAKGEYDSVMFTSTGPGGIFAFYALPTANLGYVFLNEFVSDFVLAIVIFAAVDPTNAFTPPAVVPWIIGFAYAVVIWGYAPVGLAANAARDVGGRLAALTIWGKQASGGRYAALAALTNIPATLLAGVFYELVLHDSSRTVTPPHAERLVGLRAYEERIRDGGVDETSDGSLCIKDGNASPATLGP
ncbi:hypothetical protein AcW1_007349 [Taiwanofungus camphoratus]|nr:hypothetical protein AcV7_006058 [Antrodia cinnamomea]KAI0953024.1 hypothetical protein AcW1_007349 [Antrodia cinnamomea]